jgi:hypothetical protein
MPRGLSAVSTSPPSTAAGFDLQILASTGDGAILPDSTAAERAALVAHVLAAIAAHPPTTVNGFGNRVALRDVAQQVWPHVRAGAIDHASGTTVETVLARPRHGGPTVALTRVLHTLVAAHDRRVELQAQLDALAVVGDAVALLRQHRRQPAPRSQAVAL